MLKSLLLNKQPSENQHHLQMFTTQRQPLHSQLQQKLLALQNQYLQAEITKYRAMNRQKLFPSLIKKFKQYSSMYISLENSYNSINQTYIAKQKEQQEVIEDLVGKVEQMQANLYSMEEEHLIKHQYQKELLLGLLQAFQVRITELLQEKQSRNQESKELIQIKRDIQAQISKQKQLIVKLSIHKQKTLQQLNYTQKCEIQPIHMLKEKNLKQYLLKTELFEKNFIHEIDQNICSKHQQFTKIENQTCAEILSYRPVEQSLSMQDNLYNLQRKLNSLTEAKLKASNQISLELMKQQLLTEQLLHKQEQALKYQQLLNFSKKQPYCIEVKANNSLAAVETDNNSQNFIAKQVVSTFELEAKVSKEREQNHNLKLKYRQLSEKLSLLHSHHQELNLLLEKFKKEHQVREEKMILENQLLKLNLQQKQLLYQSKLNLQSQQQRDNSPIKESASLLNHPRNSVEYGYSHSQSYSHSNIGALLSNRHEPQQTNRIQPITHQRNHTVCNIHKRVTNFYQNDQKNETNYQRNATNERRTLMVSQLYSPKTKIDTVIEREQERDRDNKNLYDNHYGKKNPYFVGTKLFGDIQNTIQQRITEPKPQVTNKSFIIQQEQSPKFNLTQRMPLSSTLTFDPRISELKTRLMAKFQALSQNS